MIKVQLLYLYKKLYKSCADDAKYEIIIRDNNTEFC